MRWTVSITEFAHGDKNRLVAGVALDEREQLKKEIERAFRDVADDPEEQGEALPGNSARRVVDIGSFRLILDFNLLKVSDPADDRICWVLGLMLKP